MAKGGDGNSSCLSVFGLPFDVTEREVHILFSGCVGFTRCIVVPGKAGKSPYAFVQFDAQANALVAMESREHTTWEAGVQAVAIELAKRDIPERFHSRVEQPPLPVHGYDNGHPPPPPAKRSRYEEPARGGAEMCGDFERGRCTRGDGCRYSHGQAYPPPSTYGAAPPPRHGPSEPWRSGPAIGAAPAHVVPPLSRHGPPESSWGAERPSDDGPRTLHVGGLPEGITQAELDSFLEANFHDTIVGSQLSTGGKSGGKGNFGKCFAGFVSHQAAMEAQALLQGFDWEGSILRAEWARSEFRSKGSGRGGRDAEEYERALAPAPAPLPAQGLLKDSTAPYGEDGGAKYGGEGKYTVHFTNLPSVSEEEFHGHMAEKHGEQIIGSRFVDKHDGRPPVAWVLFSDDSTAADVVNNAPFDWNGQQVAANYARKELNPSQLRKY